MPDKLKPCPFCGGEATARRYKDVEFLVHNADCFMVLCGGCGCGTSYEPTEEAAADTWNRRTPDIVLCGECGLHGACMAEDVFGIARMKDENRFCAAGKRKEAAP
jgi:Lar family restriction alleviation protein